MSVVFKSLLSFLDTHIYFSASPYRGLTENTLHSEFSHRYTCPLIPGLPCDHCRLFLLKLECWLHVFKGVFQAYNLNCPWPIVPSKILNLLSSTKITYFLAPFIAEGSHLTLIQTVASRKGYWGVSRKSFSMEIFALLSVSSTVLLPGIWRL